MNEENASVDAWNVYLKKFMVELCETFPDCPELFVLVAAIDAMILEDPKSVMKKFMDEMNPFAAALQRRDDNVFLKEEVDFLKRLNLKKFWTPELEPETKQAIWDYLQHLLVMANTISSVPPQLLRALEKYSEKITASIPDGQDPTQNVNMFEIGMGAFKFMEENNPEVFQQMMEKNAPGGDAMSGIFAQMSMSSVQKMGGGGSGIEQMMQQMSGGGLFTTPATSMSSEQEQVLSTMTPQQQQIFWQYANANAGNASNGLDAANPIPLPSNNAHPSVNQPPFQQNAHAPNHPSHLGHPSHPSNPGNPGSPSHTGNPSNSNQAQGLGFPMMQQLLAAQGYHGQAAPLNHQQGVQQQRGPRPVAFGQPGYVLPTNFTAQAPPPPQFNPQARFAPLPNNFNPAQQQTIWGQGVPPYYGAHPAFSQTPTVGYPVGAQPPGNPGMQMPQQPIYKQPAYKQGVPPPSYGK